MSACGIETYLYIAPVEDSRITTSANYLVDFRVPDNYTVSLNFQQDSDEKNIPIPPSISAGDNNSRIADFYLNYEIYYRIYISNVVISSISESNLSDINTTLYNDYASLKSYTVNTNNTASAGVSIFTNRNYYAINDDYPNLPQILRSSELVTPYPNQDQDQRYFQNDRDLRNNAYLNTNNNADVASSPAVGNYCYVSMYVVHKSYDSQTLQISYSSPTHLGVFLLPDSNTP